MENKQKGLSTSISNFIEAFNSRQETELFRHAVAFDRSAEHKFLVSNVLTARKILNKWFGRKLYVRGYGVKDVNFLQQDFDYGFKTGIGFSVEGFKTGQFKFGRFFVHLLDVIAGKDAKIRGLQEDVKRRKEELLAFEEAILKICKDLSVPELVRAELAVKFYWLTEN